MSPTEDVAWWRIANSIAAGIRGGRLAVGDRIPGSRQLGPTHGVDPNTAREATAYLRDIGVLRTVPGSGTYVAAVPPDQLPEPVKVSPLERRLNARIDGLQRQLDLTHAQLMALYDDLGRQAPGQGEAGQERRSG